MADGAAEAKELNGVSAPDGRAAGPAPRAEAPPKEAPQKEAPQTRISAWRFLQYAAGYWRGASARDAWTWTSLALALVFANLAVSVGLNRWNRWFFDSLEKKQGDQLLTALAVFVGLVLAGAVCAAVMVNCRMMLQTRWRSWITTNLTAKWLDQQRYYRLAITDDKQINPEFRLAEDVRLASEPVVEFTIGFINALLSALAFASILFLVGGAITIPLLGQQIWIPGYIALAALLYAVVVSSLTYSIGNPLVDRVGAKNEAEAQFRYELTRVRENAESIALIKGDSDEKIRLAGTFERLMQRWGEVVTQHTRLTGLLNANAFFAPVVPLLLATPKYLSGEMTLGAMMQVAAAFVAVLGALNWFTDNYIKLAEWSASAKRVDELYVALELVSLDDHLDRIGPIQIENGTDKLLRLDNVSIVHRDGRVMIADAAMIIEPGERVLLGGESGSGKSTLIRAIAGLWPWGEGRILLPVDSTVAFVPQRPYIPLGRLRDALAYPANGDTLSDEPAQEALKASGLGYLVERLDKVDRWDQILSGGERQRVAFARLFLTRPSVIVMDEATAALDVDSESRLLTLLFELLPDATVISVGHREGLELLHTRKLSLMRHHTGARITQARANTRRWQQIKRAAGGIKSAAGRLKGVRVKLRRGDRRRSPPESLHEQPDIQPGGSTVVPPSVGLGVSPGLPQGAPVEPQSARLPGAKQDA